MSDVSLAEVMRPPIVEESEATGDVAALYAQIKASTGAPFVPHFFKTVSSRPTMLLSLMVAFKGMFEEGTVPRTTKELVAIWVARLNECSYCVGAHSYFYRLFGGSEELTEAVKVATSPDDLPVDDKTRELLQFVTKITTSAHQITDEDWRHQTELGWTDDEVLEITYVATIFNFIVRLVDTTGLGTSGLTSKLLEMPLPAGNGRPSTASS